MLYLHNILLINYTIKVHLLCAVSDYLLNVNLLLLIFITWNMSRNFNMSSFFKGKIIFMTEKKNHLKVRNEIEIYSVMYERNIIVCFFLSFD